MPKLTILLAKLKSKRTEKMKDKHPYYNSNKKPTSEMMALKMLAWTIIVITILCVIIKHA